jgi:hypothetical protein
VEEAFNSLRNANLDGKMVVLPQAGAMVKVCALIPLSHCVDYANENPN